MSKLIVDMEMPTRCPCVLAVDNIGWFSPCFADHGIPSRTKDFDDCIEKGTRPDWCPIKGELVLCGKCYYKDEKRIMDEDALWCRKHHMYVTADWFCADGARKEAGVYVNGEVAFINGGPEAENEFALDETEDIDK